MIDLKKPLIKRYHDHLIIQARRGKIMTLSQRLVQDCVYQTNEVMKGYVSANYKPILMEMWEYELRQKLERELDGSIFYQIGSPPYVAMTGKGGYINFEVAMHREVRKFSTIEGDYFY